MFKPSQGVWEQGGGNVPLIICRATAQGHAESCEDLAPTVTAAAGMSGNNQPIVTVPVSAGFMRNPGGGAGGIGYEEELSPTLLADRPPGVVSPVGFGQKSYDQYEAETVAPTLKAKGGSYGGGTEVLISAGFMISPSGRAQGIGYEEEKSPTLLVSGPHGVLTSYPIKSCDGGGKNAMTEDDILYLVRKLTPTECASLQGFEKDWCALVEHKDAPEYKMWGNGMAFPCVLYVMEGIAEVLQRRYLEALFGGSSDG